MRNIIFFIVLVYCIGCSKEPKSDIPNPGISFLYGGNGKNDFSLRASTTPQKIPGLLVVNLRDDNPADADIRVTLRDNSTAIVNAFNAANGTSIAPLPASNWIVPSELVIKKGEQYTSSDITINNTTGMLGGQQYAIGLTITGVSNGASIADSLGNLLIVCRIPFDLEGRYSMRGKYLHPLFEPTFAQHNTVVELHVKYGFNNEVTVYWPFSGGYDTPIFTNGGQPMCCFWGHELSLKVDENTNSVHCRASHPAPNADVFYSPLASYNGTNYSSKYDPATKTFYIAFGYYFNTNYTILPNSRAWIDTLTYLGPR